MPSPRIVLQQKRAPDQLRALVVPWLNRTGKPGTSPTTSRIRSSPGACVCPEPDRPGVVGLSARADPSHQLLRRTGSRSARGAQSAPPSRRRAGSTGGARSGQREVAAMRAVPFPRVEVVRGDAASTDMLSRRSPGRVGAGVRRVRQHRRLRDRAIDRDASGVLHARRRGDLDAASPITRPDADHTTVVCRLGFAELTFVAPDDAFFSVGAHRLVTEPRPLVGGRSVVRVRALTPTASRRAHPGGNRTDSGSSAIGVRRLQRDAPTRHSHRRLGTARGPSGESFDEFECRRQLYRCRTARVGSRDRAGSRRSASRSVRDGGRTRRRAGAAVPGGVNNGTLPAITTMSKVRSRSSPVRSCSCHSISGCPIREPYRSSRHRRRRRPR